MPGTVDTAGPKVRRIASRAPSLGGMTNPKDPWGQRPEDAPTEHLGPPGYGQQYQHGGVEYPPTEHYDPWSAPPPPNATREFPPMDTQWGAYESGAQPAGQWTGNQWVGAPGQQPPGQQPPGGQFPPQQEPPKRNTGLWIALGLGVVALVAVVGVAAGMLLGGDDEDAAAAGTSTTHTLPFPTAGPSTTGELPGLPVPSGLPGLPEMDGLGATMGTITANDGGTLTLSTVAGGTVTVRTDASTQVISLSGVTPGDLPVGDMVMVQGDKGQDGSITAKIIISTALPGGGR